MAQRATKRNPAVEQRISDILAEVVPMLRIEHCTLELVEFSPESGRVILRIDGGCPDCQVSPATFSPAIQAHIRRRIPEVREVTIAS